MDDGREVNTVSVILGKLEAVSSQTLDLVRDMGERLRRMEQQGAQQGAQLAAHGARLDSVEEFIRVKQEEDTRSKPNAITAAQITISLMSVGVVVLLGVIQLLS